MSSSTKRKHVYAEVLSCELRVPAAGEEVVRVLAGRGNNLHEVEAASGDCYLVSMPAKFRRNVWVKRGDYVLVEQIPEGDKVKAEIVTVLTKDYIRFLKNQNCWPDRFQKEEEEKERLNVQPTHVPASSSSSSSSSEED